MSQSPEICPNCRKPMQAEATGSLTQWILVCKCNELDVTPSEGLEPIKVCLDCGRRINKGRSGTFTQWIFRKDICDCEVPNPRSAPYIEEDIDLESTEELPSLLKNINELKVDKDKFPVERFAPIELIGSTLDSKIYLAIDRLLGSKVAIKIVSLLESTSIIQFQTEVQTLAGLHHDGIVKVFDFSQISGAPYMVMEYIEGPTLREYLKSNTKLSVDDTLLIVKLLCDSLSYCHSKDVLHRDIKPENILLNETDSDSIEIKLLDFGLACSYESTIAKGDTIAGTPQYMAPDVGKGKRYDTRSDIYSLGCMMFELLTGKLPYEAESPLQLLRKHAQEETPDINSIAPEISFDNTLCEIVAKCMEKDPEDRYQSIEELEAEIELYCEELNHNKPAIEEPAALNMKTTEHKIREKKLRVTTIGAVVLLALIPIGIMFVAIGSLLNPDETADAQKNNKPRSHTDEDRILRLIKMQAKKKSHKYTFRIRPVYKSALEFIAKRDDRSYIEFFGADFQDPDDLLALKNTCIETVSASLSNMTDAHLARLLKMKNLANLKAGSTGITSLGIKLISENKNMHNLQLDKVVDDEGLKYLSTLPYLNKLQIRKCPITDEGLLQLKNCKYLRELDISLCNKVTASGIKSFRKELPLCKIVKNSSAPQHVY